MPVDVEALILEKLNGIEAQLRSVTATINSNNTEVQGRLITIERDFAAHLEADTVSQSAMAEKLTQHETDIVDLAKELGTEVHTLTSMYDELKKTWDDFKELKSQAAGAGKVWKAALALAGFVLVIANILHIAGH